VLTFGEFDSETDNDLIHFRHFRHSKEVWEGILATVDSQDGLEHRSSKGPGLL